MKIAILNITELQNNFLGRVKFDAEIPTGYLKAGNFSRKRIHNDGHFSKIFSTHPHLVMKSFEYAVSIAKMRHMACFLENHCCLSSLRKWEKLHPTVSIGEM